MTYQRPPRRPRRRYEPKELRPSGWWELLACLISLGTLAAGYWLLVYVFARHA